jgi:hypothetical protein
MFVPRVCKPVNAHASDDAHQLHEGNTVLAKSACSERCGNLAIPPCGRSLDIQIRCKQSVPEMSETLRKLNLSRFAHVAHYLLSLREVLRIVKVALRQR